MQTTMHDCPSTQNACIEACTGYDTQPCCPPLIVIATALQEGTEMRGCLFSAKDKTARSAANRKSI